MLAFERGTVSSPSFAGAGAVAAALWFRAAIPRPAPPPALRNQASLVDKVSEPVLQGAVLERRRERLGDSFGVQGHRFLNGGQGVFRYGVRLLLRQWMWIRVAGSFGRWQNRKTEWASGRYLVPTAITRDGRWIAFTYSTQLGQFRSRDTLKVEENFRN